LNVYRLKNTIQEYPWGSPTAIPALLGITNPEGKPKAEMWMGTHPKSPSTAIDDQGEVSLPDLIQSDPQGFLGDAVAQKFNGMLPFLFKLLAADKALSIQAHPNLSQAKAGFERENKQEIPLDAPHRNYRDPNHKPEIICALTPFWAMCGFRPVAQIVTNLGFLETTALGKQYGEFSKRPGAKSLRKLFLSLLNLERSDADAVVTASFDMPAVDDQTATLVRWIKILHKQQPGDIGAICPLLLNTYRLKPGEAIYLEAGELHAYLEGFGVELMANSDNVLRGGLTTKHVDHEELLRTLTFKTETVPILSGTDVSPELTVFETPAEEFRLGRITVSEKKAYKAQGDRNAEILIVIEDSCSLRSGTGDGLELAKGESVFVPASAPPYEIAGPATLFRATVP
jgi:mannose-6-phosphate isomerase